MSAVSVAEQESRLETAIATEIRTMRSEYAVGPVLQMQTMTAFAMMLIPALAL